MTLLLQASGRKERHVTFPAMLTYPATLCR